MPRLATVLGAVLNVTLTESLRNQNLNGLSSQLLPGIAKYSFHLRVDFSNVAFRVGYNDGIGRRLKQLLEQSLRSVIERLLQRFPGHLLSPFFSSGTVRS